MTYLTNEFINANAVSPSAAAAAGDDEEKGGPRGAALEALKKTRTIEMFGVVNTVLARRIISQLLFLESEDADKPITVLQNSPGGSVTDGFAIYDAMRFVKPELKIVCLGLTASIATITLLGAKKENRLTLPNTEFLIHQPLIHGNVVGVASDLEITARQILKTRELINEMLARETGSADRDRVAPHRARLLDERAGGRRLRARRAHRQQPLRDLSG